MFNMLFGWKAVAIAFVGALVVGFGGGVWVRDAFCDAAAANLRVKVLEQQLEEKDRQIDVANTLRNRDAEAAAKAIQEARGDQEKIDATPHDARPCLDGGASERVRNVR